MLPKRIISSENLLDYLKGLKGKRAYCMIKIVYCHYLLIINIYDSKILEDFVVD